MEGEYKISAFTVIEAGIKLGFNEKTIATACIFYHKYHARTTSEVHTDDELLVMASLSLASKVQEQLTKISDVVNTCYRCMHKDKPPLEVSDLYWQLKESVGKYELILLRALRFDMAVHLPHPYLCHFLLALARWVDPEAWAKSHIAQLSWALLQDCYTTDLCLKEPSHILALAVLYLAMHCCRLHVPGSEQAKRPWWQAFCQEVSQDKLQDISLQIMQCINTANGNVT